MTRVMRTPLDARGVEIVPGDRVIYGFGLSRSVAMAEGEVVEDHGDVSVTTTGLVRVRIIRRSYNNGEKPVVAIMPDRLVVLKPILDPENPQSSSRVYVLPWSPQPTQDELNYDQLVSNVERYTDSREHLRSGGELSDSQARTGNYPDYIYDRSPEHRAHWIDWYTRNIARSREALVTVCARLGKPMPSGMDEG